MPVILTSAGLVRAQDPRHATVFRSKVLHVNVLRLCGMPGQTEIAATTECFGTTHDSGVCGACCVDML